MHLGQYIDGLGLVFKIWVKESIAISQFSLLSSKPHRSQLVASIISSHLHQKYKGHIEPSAK